jgi:hypothetical protein
VRQEVVAHEEAHEHEVVDHALEVVPEGDALQAAELLLRERKGDRERGEGSGRQVRRGREVDSPRLLRTRPIYMNFSPRELARYLQVLA